MFYNVSILTIKVIGVNHAASASLHRLLGICVQYLILCLEYQSPEILYHTKQHHMIGGHQPYIIKRHVVQSFIEDVGTFYTINGEAVLTLLIIVVSLFHTFPLLFIR
jgi:hypothetical protein